MPIRQFVDRRHRNKRITGQNQTDVSRGKPSPTQPCGLDPPYPRCAGLSGEVETVARLPFGATEHLCHPVCKSPSPPFGGEREGPLAHRRCATRQAHARVRREGREGEVGDATNRFVGPPHPPSPPGRRGGRVSRCRLAGHFADKLSERWSSNFPRTVLRGAGEGGERSEAGEGVINKPSECSSNRPAQRDL